MLGRPNPANLPIYHRPPGRRRPWKSLSLIRTKGYLKVERQCRRLYSFISNFQ